MYLCGYNIRTYIGIHTYVHTTVINFTLCTALKLAHMYVRTNIKHNVNVHEHILFIAQSYGRKILTT